MDLSVLLPAQHTSPSPAQRSSSAAWPLGSTPGGEQTASEASALDPHRCPSHQTTSPPSPGNFLRSLHVPDLCPRSVLRGQFVPLALSSGTSGACVIRNEYDNVAADRQSAPRSPFDLPRSHQPASRSPPGLSGGLAVMGSCPGPQACPDKLSKSCSTSLMGPLIWGAAGAFLSPRWTRACWLQLETPLKLCCGRQAQTEAWILGA